MAARLPAAFLRPEHEGDTVRRYLPFAAIALLIVAAAVFGSGPYWP
jgi:hypothetical protein